MWQPKTERCAFLVDNLDLETATGFIGAKWEHFQLLHLQDDNVFRIEVKSRQIAWSWTSAAEAVADGILNGVGSVFVSINLDEAKEKIRYALNVIEALPKPMRPKLLTNNRTELEFDTGARLISLPATAPRGKASMNVYLDEFAHVRDDVVIYTAALPMISKGNRRLRVASSPMGGSGRFWEIATESLRKYPGYNRKVTPWWEASAFCTNVKEARRFAPRMTTAERVKKYGNDRIQTIFDNMPDEDAQQEYECAFVDEAAAWITWEEIKALQAMHSGQCLIVEGVDRAKEAIDELGRLIAAGVVEGVLAAGVDIGRTRNTTEIYIGGCTTLESYPLRLAITLDNCEFDDQFEVLQTAVSRLPIKKMLIDKGGIGYQLAENMAKKFPVKVEGADFTNKTKELWATNVKMLAQQRRAPIPSDRDMSYQIHSIKRAITPSKNFIFDTDRNEKHHADKFWAWALMLTASAAPAADWLMW